MGAPVKLKKDVIPHTFDCQPHRVKKLNNFSRPAYNNLNRKREIAEILSDAENQNKNNSPSTSTLQQPLYKTFPFDANITYSGVTIIFS